MRIFKFWVEHKEELAFKNTYLGTDEKQLFTFYGGSNFSSSDAHKDALKRRDVVLNRIRGIDERMEDYDVDIREELIKEIDPDNIVTRNRYGALVLNSANTLILDIDDAQFYERYSVSFFKRLLGLSSKINSPSQIKAFILSKATSKEYSHYTFRLYRTPVGFRLFILGQPFQARSGVVNKFIKMFYVDHLYASMCKRQNCFRARLTPKPYRIGQKGLKVIFPNRTPQQTALHNEWVKQYDKKSGDYAACQFVIQIGNHYLNDVVTYHDKICKVHSDLQLA